MRILPDTTEDPGFVQIVESIASSVTLLNRPEVVAFVRVDNWFGFKWLKFSGVVHLQLGVWRRRTTLPPFHPSRIQSQTVYNRQADGAYQEVAAEPIHVAQRSLDNVSNSLADHGESLLFVWWSGNTLANGRGSVMVYSRDRRTNHPWYASLVRGDEWQLHQVRAIPHDTVQGFMNPSPPRTRRGRTQQSLQG